MRAEGYVLVGHTLYAPGDEIPGDEQPDEVPADAVTDQTEDEKTEDDEPSEAVSPWAKTAKAELLAEVNKRNADREDDAKIAPASNKVGDLRAALDADDAALAAASE